MYFPITSPACSVLEGATVRQIRGLLVSEELATDEETDRHLASVATGRLDLAAAPMISAWRHRPCPPLAYRCDQEGVAGSATGALLRGTGQRNTRAKIAR